MNLMTFVCFNRDRELRWFFRRIIGTALRYAFFMLERGIMLAIAGLAFRDYTREIEPYMRRMIKRSGFNLQCLEGTSKPIVFWRYAMLHFDNLR